MYTLSATTKYHVLLDQVCASIMQLQDLVEYKIQVVPYTPMHNLSNNKIIMYNYLLYTYILSYLHTSISCKVYIYLRMTSRYVF